MYFLPSHPWIMLLMLVIITSPNPCLAFSPQSNAELKSAINASLDKRASPCTSEQETKSKSGSVGVVFDLDGVTYHNSPAGIVATPGIIDAIKRLLKAKIPFAFMTNNEDSESAKAANLSNLLGLPLGPERVVTSLTPYRGLVQKYGNARVLVIGRAEAVQFARDFGFTNHVGLTEYVDSHRQLVPHLPAHKFKSGDSAEQRDNQKIKAILVFSEPDDWHTALQVMVDVLSSDGEPCEELGGHASSTQVVDLFFSNLDFTYPASHSVPRLTQGAFRVCLDAMFTKMTGRQLAYTLMGKPSAGVFDMARRRIEAQMTEHTGSTRSVDTIYMVGDNPKSDIRGANAMGTPWVSVLVRTGIFRGAVNDETDPAQLVVANAATAIDNILRSIPSSPQS